jgi:hypothetical protein
VDQVRPADYTIWLVALLLYVYDAARFLSPQELLLVEAGRGRLAPASSDNPFTARGRVLAFGPLHLPHRGVFVVTWGRAWVDGPRLSAALDSVGRLRDALTPARVPAALGGALLFVVGPVLTLRLGPDAAVVYTAAALYPTAVAAIVVVWWRRRAFRLSAARAAWLSVEMLVCPAFLPNLVRKVTGQEPVEADGAQILAATAADDVKTEFLERLETRTQAMLDETAPDPSAQADLRAYLATLRAAR